ncbi:hypothetical protein VTI74DRAFT_7438 [Chaetomium olivicolor]
MGSHRGEDAYASLLLTDTYLPGALVLAHSLRDAGTTKKLAILVTLDSVSAEVITQLRNVYDYVIPVSRIQNEHPANLDLMNRRDLHSAFTKLNLWKQTQFRKIVYMDADMVAYRAPDELFDLPHAFAAAPDIGWPDIFNTGLMVLTPNLGDYHAMMAMAQRGISFDGADQGLLNMYFRNGFHRLSFTYNVTPSAHYQYVPAYKHFQSSINVVHFIGTEKPWIQGRDRSTGSSPFDQMVGRWWAVYDRHYHKDAIQAASAQPQQQVPPIVQYFVKGEYQPQVHYRIPVGEPPSVGPGSFHGQQYQPPAAPSHAHLQYFQHGQHSFPQPEQHIHHDHHQHHLQHQQQPHDFHPPPPQPGSSAESSAHSVIPTIPSISSVPSQPVEGTDAEARQDQATDRNDWASHPPTQSQPQPDLAPSWDAQRHPPPPNSKPEAINFPTTQYKMSYDTTPFVPPEKYPDAPTGMWFKTPSEPPTNESTFDFGWEAYRPKPARTFAPPPAPPAPPVEPAPASAAEVEPVCSDSPDSQPGERREAEQTQGEDSSAARQGQNFPESAKQPALPETPPPQPSHPVGERPSPLTLTPPRSLANLKYTNAWDQIPAIQRWEERYQARMLQERRARARAAGKTLELDEEEDIGIVLRRRRPSLITDFPSADERPSLPVTPAPVLRTTRAWYGDYSFGGGGGGSRTGERLLPDAEGVPPQSEWNPTQRLEQLVQEKGADMLQRLDAALRKEAERGELPARPMPFGSEDARSPTYVAPYPPVGRSGMTEVVSPKPVKPCLSLRASPVEKMMKQVPEHIGKQEAGNGNGKGGRMPVEERLGSGIPPPSYQGPGTAFEKGEDIPTYETPALPTEEEMDVLET